MYKVIMEGISECFNIIMHNNIKTKEEALELKNKCEQNDGIHYFKIIEEE